MADGYVERGEVYWIGNSGLANLGVIVSVNSDNISDDFVAVATICGIEPRRGVRTMVTGKPSWVACSNVRTAPKSALRSFVGVLSKAEMTQVDDELEGFFDLGYEDGGKDKEIERLKSENARLKRDLEYAREGMMSRIAEVERIKKLYDKAVDQIADMTLAADVARRIAEKTALVEEEEISEEEPPVEEEPEVPEVEILDEDEVEETPSRITFPVWEPPVEKPVVVAPVKKVNVNQATEKELMDLGFSKSAAGRIKSHVKRYGPYKKVDDLKSVDDVPSKLIRKLKDVLEV